MHSTAKRLRDKDYAKGRLGIEDDWKLYDLVRRGIVPAVRLGRLIRFDEDQLEAWIKNGGQKLGEAA